jgi:hypothetical protein
VNQDIVVLKHGLDISMGIIKMRINTGLLVIFEVDPLAMLDLGLLDLFLHTVVIESPLVNDT